MVSHLVFFFFFLCEVLFVLEIKREKKGMELGGWKGPERVEGEEKHGQDILKKVFNKKEKKFKNHGSFMKEKHFDTMKKLQGKTISNTTKIPPISIG